MTTPPKRRKFGDILVEGGLITATQLQQALAFGADRDIKLGEALRELGFVNDAAVANTIARQLKIPFIDFHRIVVDPEVAQIIPEAVSRKYKVLALGKRPGEVLVAFADPLNIFAVDEVGRYIKDKTVVCVGIEAEIVAAMDRLYASAVKDEQRFEDTGEESATVSAINEILLKAVRQRASDIHIEPDHERVRVRNRVDGILREANTFPMDMHPNLISRIKIMAHLDIGERRKPQDGRFEMPISGKEFDVRVSILPLNAGEKVVMRLLDKGTVRFNLQDLGFEPYQRALFIEHLSRPHEIILVTGPTGSGKTTTLYGALNYLNSVEKNIVTVEDPVEYELAGINQVQVNVRADLTFANSLRSILRQDPDIIMIGEIRDAETAEIAIQSALTGHLVLSTLHTNDAAGAVTRLIEMGIPPFLIASAVGLVVAQRLLRLLCPSCKAAFTPPEELQEALGLAFDPARLFYKPVGCDKCEGSGFKGRIAIYETMVISQAIEELILKKASSHDIFRQAQKEDLTSLRQSSMAKVISGQTSVDEAFRVTMELKE
ncbi:MAG: ATPase, T2SS/T4P/T4SS family [Deltaproteobacteria bacterium]|nr:ATPase, T2SS/T4P/T4SS family [Deltaproteobacteria bacterium]